jgi:hypothetical protein
VPVRVLAGDASQAIVADFQNLWGGVLAFGIFGALPLAFGAFFFGIARADSPERRGQDGAKEARCATAAISPTRDRLASNLTIAGNIVVLAGFIVAFIGDDPSGLGRAFLVIGLGATLFAIAFWLKGGSGWQAPAICLIVALGFVLFGAGAMLLSGR